MLATLGAILIALWILGLVLKIAGTFVHIALLIGIGLLVFHFIKAKG
ncbi:MAG TPA: DUF5670 family protein [Chthoniobacterales bacterium]|jgi:hypothetical protein